MVYWVKEFHRYLYGRKSTLLTDHQQMTHIFHPNKAIPLLAKGRLQRWALLLSTYDYDINFKHSKDQGNADRLSRLPLPSNEFTVGEEGVTIFNVAQIQAPPFIPSKISS